jgi:phosphoglycerate dehydrogenase-like enzyme
MAFRRHGEEALQSELRNAMAAKRKVCLTGPPRIAVAQDTLRNAGCELVLGKPQDDFRDFRYERKDLIKLIGDCPILFPAGRDVITAEILDSCSDLQAVVKSSIGIETVDVEAATDLGIICCNSPTPENYLGVAEATIGLMVAQFKRLKFNEAFLRTHGWKAPESRGSLMLGKTVGIIGVGRIGRNVAKRLGGWEMKILGYDPYVKQEDRRRFGYRNGRPGRLTETVRRGDVARGAHARDSRHDRHTRAEADEADGVSRQYFARAGDQRSRSGRCFE